MATAIGVAGVLAVWTFEAGRDRLLTEGRLFGVDADLLWQGPVEEVDEAVAAAGETPGIEAVGVRQRLDVELNLAGPGGTTERLRRRSRRPRRLGRSDDRRGPRRSPAG